MIPARTTVSKNDSRRTVRNCKTKKVKEKTKNRKRERRERREKEQSNSERESVCVCGYVIDKERMCIGCKFITVIENREECQNGLKTM